MSCFARAAIATALSPLPHTHTHTHCALPDVPGPAGMAVLSHVHRCSLCRVCRKLTTSSTRKASINNTASSTPSASLPRYVDAWRLRRVQTRADPLLAASHQIRRSEGVCYDVITMAVKDEKAMAQREAENNKVINSRIANEVEQRVRVRGAAQAKAEVRAHPTTPAPRREC